MGNLLLNMKMKLMMVSKFFANGNITNSDELNDQIAKITTIVTEGIGIALAFVSLIFVIRFIVEAVKLANNGAKPEARSGFVTAVIMLALGLVVAIGAQFFVPVLIDAITQIFKAN